MTKDIKLSNLKGLLIFLVVFGHLIELYKEEYKGLYLLIYTFHMPLFILISGYLAKHASMKRVINFTLLYLIFQPVYRWFFYVLNSDKPFELKMEVPYFQLWYLLSMAVWYVLAIGINKIKLVKWQKITLGVLFFAIGLAARYYTGSFVAIIKNYYPAFYSYTLSYQRTITFFPFFFVGLMMTEASMHKLQKSLRLKWLVTVFTIGSIYLFYVLTDTMNSEKILKGSYGLDKLKGQVSDITWQLVLGYLFAILLCFLMLNIVSNKKSFLTKLGDRSLPIYLFHVFFIIVMKKLEFLGALPTVVLFTLFVGLSVFIVWVLSLEPFIKLTHYLCNPLKIISSTVKKIRLQLE